MYVLNEAAGGKMRTRKVQGGEGGAMVSGDRNCSRTM